MNSNRTIFLAHATEDKEKVRKLYKALKDNGLDPWLDEVNLLPGVKWDDEIIHVIRKSRFFIACLSKNSIPKNGYIQKELKFALSQLEQKAHNYLYFIPVLLDDVSIPDLKVGTINLRDYQAARLYEDTGLEKLINYLINEIEEAPIKSTNRLNNSINTLDYTLSSISNTTKSVVFKNQEILANLFTGEENVAEIKNKIINLYHKQKNRGNFSKWIILLKNQKEYNDEIIRNYIIELVVTLENLKTKLYSYEEIDLSPERIMSFDDEMKAGKWTEAGINKFHLKILHQFPPEKAELLVSQYLNYLRDSADEIEKLIQNIRIRINEEF